MSAWLWLVAGGAAGLWWAVNREKGGASGKGGGHGGGAGHGSGGKGGGGKETAKRLLNFALWLVAVVALIHAPLPFDTYLAQIGANVTQKVYGFFGISVPASAVAEITLWILTIAALIDLKGRRVDYVARTFVVVAPMLAIISTGPLGDGVETALGNLNGGSVQVVQDLAK